MKKIRNKAAFLLVLLALSAFALEAYAAGDIDTNAGVELHYSASYANYAIRDMECRLYQLALFRPDGSYELTRAFESYPLVLEESSVADAAYALAAYVKRDAPASVDAGRTDDRGELNFPTEGKSLQPGIYLLLSEPIEKGHYLYEAAPTLVSLPTYDSAADSLLYSVNAQAKLSRTPKSVNPPSPSPSAEDKISKLPKTGDLRWPVPVLLVWALLIPLLPKRKKENAFALSVMLLAAALLLVCFNEYINHQRELSAEENLLRLEELLMKEKAEPPQPETKQVPVEEADESLPEYVTNPERPMPERRENGYDFIGVLSIDAISMDLPVTSRWSYDTLSIGPTRYAGSVYRDNMVIAGHNNLSHFGYLRELRLGDTVAFTDMDGNTFYYTVSEIEILQPTEVYEMLNGDWDLTLFTCTYDGSARVTVRCEKTE